MNLSLNRSLIVIKTNESGGAHAQGDIGVESGADANSVINDTSGAFSSGPLWVCLEPNGVADGARGAYASAGFVPKINLSSSASLGDLVKSHTVAKQGAAHAAPIVEGDFAQVLGTGASPSAWLFGSPIQPSSSSPFELVLDQDGADFSDWTSGGGTWASDGTVIEQTDATAAWRTAKYDIPQPIAPGYILEADIKALSAGAGALHAIGLIIGYDGTITGQGAMVELRLASATRRFIFSRAFTLFLLELNPHAWNDDQFYKLRLISSGGILSAYLDGTLIGSAGSSPANGGDARYIGLASYGCAAEFKNMKGWSLTLPA